MYQRETQLHDQGYRLVAGIDEAGRGPLAGPVFAAAVILPDNITIDGLNDSKKLSEKKRESLYNEITTRAVSYSVQFVGERTIDSINIRQATHMAMENAVLSLDAAPDYLLIDGNDNIPFAAPHEYIIKGDQTCAAIAAASILAKVSRDRYMKMLSHKYPEYQLDKHKGYGTQTHMEAIRKFGVSDIHRKTFMTAKVLGTNHE